MSYPSTFACFSFQGPLVLDVMMVDGSEKSNLLFSSFLVQISLQVILEVITISRHSKTSNVCIKRPGFIQSVI